MKKLYAAAFCSVALVGCEQTSIKEVSWDSYKEQDIQYAYTNILAFCEKSKKGPTFVAGESFDFKPACKSLKEDSSLETFKAVFTPAEIHKTKNQFFRKPSAKVTAYYTPALSGSYTKTETYNVPVHSKPKNLVQIHTKLFDEDESNVWIGMIQGNKVVPYYERAEIEQMNGDVLFYTDSLVDKFFLQVQGSGYVNFENGEKKLAAFAAHNGKPYTSIGKVLVDDGELTLENADMFSIKSWIQGNPEQMKPLFNTNPRYIFFGWGRDVKGSSKKTLEAFRSAAIDPKTMSYGLPFILKTTRTVDNTEQTYRLRADDTGGAIKGVGRVDIYAGDGKEAEKMAAHQNSDGEMVVFLPRAL
ncbi:MAG: MltA domain-containing protein [Pseudomonadota bacterium]|nr:MltA domain-containing protein [Pseudomonadota bacterium]